jgi:hypothetical protein
MVLEVAAGAGLVTPALARAAKGVVATDYAPAMIEALDARIRKEGLANVRCERADLYALRFESASFDAVVAANVLHLVPDLPGGVSALRRGVDGRRRARGPDVLPRQWRRCISLRSRRVSPFVDFGARETRREWRQDGADRHPWKFPRDAGRMMQLGKGMAPFPRK